MLRCSSLGLLASSSKKFGRLSGYAERIAEAEDAAKQIALDTSRECRRHCWTPLVEWQMHMHLRD